MNKTIIRLMMLMLSVMLFPAAGATAQNPIKGKDAAHIIESISDGYKNWSRAAWSGKLSTDMLPLSATMKVYMEKGKLTLISVRAPFVGEVGRVEIDPGSVLIVNKMKHCYYRRSIADISQMSPDLTEDIQALLLGRMFVVGQGELSKKSADRVSIFPASGEGCYMILPDVPDYLSQVVYGFSTDADNRLATFVAAYGREAVAVEQDDEVDPGFTFEPEVQLQAEIRYRNGKGAVADIQASMHGHTYTATLTADDIEWGGKGFSRIDVSGYKSTSFRQVLKF